MRFKKWISKRIQFRADSETLEKINYIAAHYGISVKEQVIHLIENCVSEYEAKIGPIEVEPKDKE